MKKFWYYNERHNRILMSQHDLPRGQFSKPITESEACDLHIRKGAGITEIDRHGRIVENGDQITEDF